MADTMSNLVKYAERRDEQWDDDDVRKYARGECSQQSRVLIYLIANERKGGWWTHDDDDDDDGKSIVRSKQCETGLSGYNYI